MESAKEINDFIEKNFAQAEQSLVIKKIEKIFQTKWNIGADQIARSLLYLADHKYSQLISLLNFTDPRDLVTDAERKAGNPGHYFNIPFDKMPN